MFFIVEQGNLMDYVDNGVLPLYNTPIQANRKYDVDLSNIWGNME